MMRTVAHFEAVGLNLAEEKLIDAVRTGRNWVLQDTSKTVPDADDNPKHTIRADLLALLITGGTPACGLSPFGVYLYGAYITGTLSLTNLRAVGGTVLGFCRFANAPNMRNARFEVLKLTGSHLPGLNAQGVEVRTDLFFARGESHGQGECERCQNRRAAFLRQGHI